MEGGRRDCTGNAERNIQAELKIGKGNDSWQKSDLMVDFWAWLGWPPDSLP